MAETFTEKLKLSKRDTGDLNWGQGANANLEAVDAHSQQAILRPPRTLLATLGSGAVGANLTGNTAYFYKATAVNAAGETTEGKIPAIVEAQVTQPATPLPVIIQWDTVKGATSYKIYKAAASGLEKLLASVSGESTSTFTDDGNTATDPGISVPASNTARTSVSKIVAGNNITITPVDGTGEVTINAAGAAGPADASDVVKGISKLSVAPAVAANPIAVGDNDSRNSNSRTPAGTASGDLSGSYPSPTVAKLQTKAVSALAPTDGQVLKYNAANVQWEPATPAAGGGGYATVVVAAPTGIAATDTTNIQNALNSASTQGGGTVLLREGTYKINATLTVPAKVTLKGMGAKATVISADTTVTGAVDETWESPPMVILADEQSAIEDMTLDDNARTETNRWAEVKSKAARDAFIRRCRFVAKASGVWTGSSNLALPLREVCIDESVFEPAASVLSTHFSIESFGKTFARNCHFLNKKLNVNGHSSDTSGGGTGNSRAAFQNCFFEITTGNSHSLVNGINVLVDGCNFRIIDTYAAASTTISLGENSVFTNNHIDVSYTTTASAVINLQGSPFAEHRCVVSANRIKGSNFTDGIRLTSNKGRNTIADNQIDDAASYGIRLMAESQSGGTASSNNVIVGNRTNVIRLESWGSVSTDPSGNLIVANKAAISNASLAVNTIVDTFITGLRKLGEAAALAGDVKLEAGSNITMTQDAVNNKISIAAAAGGAWTKIADVSLAEWWSTSGTIAVPAGDADLFKLLLEVNQADGGALTLNMFVNGRLTLTDYYSQKLLIDGASVTADRANSPRIAEFLAGQIGFVEMIFGPTHDTVSGNVRFSVLQPQGSPLGVSIPKIILYQWLHTLQMAQYPVNDLESIVIKPAGGQAAGGSRLRLYKLV
jgi:hypothetical protein